MHRTKREFVNEVLIRKRPFPKLPALVSPPGGYAGITWTQPHANKAVEAGVHTSLSIPVKAINLSIQSFTARIIHNALINDP